MRLSSLLGSALLLFTSSLGYPQTDTAHDKLSYEAMVEKAKADAKGVDFRALRLAYVDSKTRKDAKDLDPQKKEMKVAIQNKDFAKAISKADEILKSKFVDMDAHYAKYVAFREQGQPDQAEIEKTILQGLLQSITSSGDGKTPETAWQVIEVHEEYVVLQFSGLMPTGQALVEKNGHSLRQDDGRQFQDERGSHLVLQCGHPFRPVFQIGDQVKDRPMGRSSAAAFAVPASSVQACRYP